MEEELIARLSRRYIALDIHKHYSIVAGVNFDGKVEPVRVEHENLEAWLGKHIQPSDYVVIESTTNAWYIYDLLEPLAEKVLVANPIKVKQIAQARVKTDIRDTLILARLLAANMIPAIWVPPEGVRELRYLLSQPCFTCISKTIYYLVISCQRFLAPPKLPKRDTFVYQDLRYLLSQPCFTCVSKAIY